MASDKENKTFECPFCHKNMNRKFSFERHKKNCEDRLKGKCCRHTVKFVQVIVIVEGGKSSSFEPYQCPSPKMAQKSAGAFIDNFLPRLSQMYR